MAGGGQARLAQSKTTTSITCQGAMLVDGYWGKVLVNESSLKNAMRIERPNDHTEDMEGRLYSETVLDFTERNPDPADWVRGERTDEAQRMRDVVDRKT